MGANDDGADSRADALARLRGRRSARAGGSGPAGQGSSAPSDTGAPPDGSVALREVPPSGQVLVPPMGAKIPDEMLPGVAREMAGVIGQMLGGAPAPQAEEGGGVDVQYKEKEFLAWMCRGCKKECIPIRTESRCLCGHRMKEHAPLGSSGALSCKNTRCKCKKFFYIVAEGSWVLRCRCKHKHIEHDPVTRKCTKAGCKTCPEGGFDSPWVCNCNHPWAEHDQVVVKRKVMVLNGAQETVVGEGPADEVNRWDLIKRGDADGG
ncbi:unnamed protein product [Pedinophyceae sp. YPF-701]|nr:unnamed protein product [Pedinophyceae sp. YPF-701]